MKWETHKIGLHCDITSSKRIFLSEYVNSGIPFYRSKEIIECASGQTISEPLFISLERYHSIKDQFGVPVAGDMLLTSVGTIGVSYIVKPTDCFYFKDGNLTWFRNFSPDLDSRFLSYWISSTYGLSMLNGITIGSSQKALTISALKDIDIPVPPIDVQRRIADILSAYDDLIENNRNQIKLLEEAAQRLYKEWFVDLRFPGWESTPVLDGLPEGWRKSSANSFFDITIGKTPPRAETKWFSENQSDIKWLSIADMGKSSVYVLKTSEFLTKEAVMKFNVKVVPADTILLSFKLTVGRVAIAADELCTNEAIAHFSAVNMYEIEYIYQYLKNFDYSTLGSTSAISQAVNSKIIKAMSFVLPSKTILEKYHKRVEPFFKKIHTLQRQIEALLTARDALLPKLMSGEIEV